MLAHFDNLLRQLLISRVPTITDEAQVRFQPPDEDWRTYVSTLSVGGNPANALNVYLVDVRENRKLRSNERVREAVQQLDGIVREVPAPVPPGKAALFVMSTVVAVMVVKRSVTGSFTAGSFTDVAVTVTLYGPPATAPGGNTAFTTTV